MPTTDYPQFSTSAIAKSMRVFGPRTKPVGVKRRDAAALIADAVDKFQITVARQHPDAVRNEYLTELPYLIDMLMDLHKDIRMNPAICAEDALGPYLLITLDLPWGGAQLNYRVQIEEHTDENGGTFLTPTPSLNHYVPEPQHPTVHGIAVTISEYIGALTRITASYVRLQLFSEVGAPQYIMIAERNLLAQRLRAIRP